jgi:cellulose synthase/poly-beta-1,6-N-acetylglucosamine synthase-like glycosyltransferase
MKSKVKEFYLQWYKWLLVGLFVLVVFNYLYSCKIFLIKDIVPYAQTIFIGLITFSIPFLWNAYQRILEIKSKARGDGIDNILAKEFYEKAVRSFEAFLLYPTAILAFLGIIISPFLPLFFLVIFIIFSSIFFLMQTRIFDWVESSASTDLKSFINVKNADSPDLLKMFKELWQIDDASIEKEFSMNTNQIMKFFSDKVNDLLK